jgi:hypothetical protein
MFKLDPEPKFWTTVRIALGDEAEQSFKARFKARDLDADEKVSEALEDLLVDVDEVTGEDGRKAVFTPDLKRALLAQPHVRLALVRAFIDGLTKGQRGN